MRQMPHIYYWPLLGLEMKALATESSNFIGHVDADAWPLRIINLAVLYSGHIMITGLILFAIPTHTTIMFTVSAGTYRNSSGIS